MIPDGRFEIMQEGMKSEDGSGYMVKSKYQPTMGDANDCRKG